MTDVQVEKVQPQFQYRILGFAFASWLLFLAPLRWFSGVRIKPENLDRTAIDRMSGGRPIVFVMERFQLLDLFVLNNVLRRFGMPAVKREARSNGFLEVAFLALRSNVLRFYGLERRDPFSDYLEDLLSHDTRLHENGVCLLPVSVFWSRGAERSERNFIFRGLFPDDGSANFFQKILLFASHGGIVDIHFGNPHIVTRNSLPELLATPGLSPIDRARRYRRVLMAELNRERTAAMGPALYEFSTVANWILADPETQKMINEGPNSKRNQKKAHHYLREMAAAYNYTTVRALEAALDFVWTRIFKGIRVRNFGAVREVARTGHILWLPCHKSHLDYLLLSYVVRKQGLVGPHIAAGVNLSFWPAGPILRRGGAFFMRRSFSGNKLYTKVFAGYVDFLMHNGYPIEYFHEGGRSRIGKLLTPRYGFTSFCVRSILRRKAAATYVVPVYFGYDKVMEDDTYAREVSGAKKHKESLWQLLASIRFLFSNYGRVDVSFGTPIHFGDFWKEYLAHHEAMGQVLLPARDGATRGSLERLEEDIDVRHPLVQSCIESLGLRVNEGINAAAVASGTSLMAVAMLAAREDSVDADRLGNRFETAAWIVDTVSRELGWKLSNAFSAVEGSFSLAESPSVLLPESRGGDEPVSSSPMPSQEALSAFHEALDSCLRWGFLTKSDNEPDAAVMATEGAATPGASHLFRYRRSEEKSLNLYWYRGTVFHIFAIPGVVGKIIQQHRDSGASSISRAALVSGFEAVRSVWKLEVFWPRATTSEQLVAAGLLILRGLGTVGECEGDQINIVQGESAGGHLDFVSGLVRTEKELYGLQLAAAIKLTEAKGSFRREELIHHAHALHRGAFLRSIVTSPASLTLVYGGRSFDALLNVGVFVLKPGNVLRLSFGALQPLTEFFDVADLNKVQV